MQKMIKQYRQFDHCKCPETIAEASLRLLLVQANLLALNVT